MKLKFNSPIVLLITLICVAATVFNYSTNGKLNQWLMLLPYWSVSNIPRFLTYAFAHANWNHLFGNLFLFLLIGPILEEKYGRKDYLIMTVITILVTAFFNVLFFDSGLLGLSGVVFMNIILSSFTNVNDREIPLTFILVFLMFVGKEFFNAFQNDNISQFAHILGGLIGAVFGFLFRKRKLL